MSRNVLRCPNCRAPLLHTRRSGRVKVMGNVATESVDAGIRLYCRCGTKRVFSVVEGKQIIPIDHRFTV